MSKSQIISQTAEYALRAVVFLADRQGGQATTHDIAETGHIPASYLAKVLQSLRDAGIVHAQRGRFHGGFTLTRDPAVLTVLDVINAVEPLQRIRVCPLGLSSHGTNLCPMHKRLDDAMAAVAKAFSDSTIAELLAAPTKSYPLCEFPRQPAAIEPTPPEPLPSDRRIGPIAL